MSETISPARINILPDRQRKNLGDLSELQASIANIGLINPIVIDESDNLIAGERRLTCCKALGLDSIPVRRFEDLSPSDKHLIELEENIKRSDLTWQEEIAAVQAYYEFLRSADESTTEASAAQKLGISAATINRQLFVASQMDHELIANSQTFTAALNTAKRRYERKQAEGKDELDAELDDLLVPVTQLVAEEAHKEAKENAAHENTSHKRKDRKTLLPIANADFTKWEPVRTDYNFIHCDFPYGIGTGDKVGQSAAKHFGTYDDSAQTYWRLVNFFLLDFVPRAVAYEAHVMFWLSMKYYTETKDAFEASGFHVNPIPLVWAKSDNKGILPDKDRSPRQITEFALFATRGDRKIVRAKGNAYWGPTTRDTHTSEKPLAMLDHFFQMLVDESTIMLDPTCGSGNSVIAAHKHRAKHIQGLELNKEFAMAAAMNFDKHVRS